MCRTPTQVVDRCEAGAAQERWKISGHMGTTHAMGEQPVSRSDEVGDVETSPGRRVTREVGMAPRRWRSALRA